MVDVVLCFVLIDLLHRPVARYVVSCRPYYRIKERPGHILVVVFGKQLAVDLDFQFLIRFGNFNATGASCSAAGLRL